MTEDEVKLAERNIRVFRYCMDNSTNLEEYGKRLAEVNCCETTEDGGTKFMTLDMTFRLTAKTYIAICKTIGPMLIEESKMMRKIALETQVCDSMPKPYEPML